MDHAAAPRLPFTAEDVPQGRRRIERAFRELVAGLGDLGYPVATDANFTETAARAARAMLELVRPAGAVEREVDELLARTFPASYDGTVTSRHNTCFGMCPHHLLPVIYRVTVAYLPGERVLGISKLSRLVQLLARRPVLQEALTEELAGVLHDRLASRGSAVFVEGLHLCMAARGIEAHEASVATSAVRGAFAEDRAVRREFLELARAPRAPLL